MSARRPLLTATAAGTLLAALWFVPSANATADRTAVTERQTATESATHTAYHTTASASEDGSRLADTGSIDTAPYLIGGTTSLGIGAGFLVYAARRGRGMAYRAG